MLILWARIVECSGSSLQQKGPPRALLVFFSLYLFLQRKLERETRGGRKLVKQT